MNLKICPAYTFIFLTERQKISYKDLCRKCEQIHWLYLKLPFIKKQHSSLSIIVKQHSSLSIIVFLNWSRYLIFVLSFKLQLGLRRIQYLTTRVADLSLDTSTSSIKFQTSIYILKVQLCKLYNNKYMIFSTQITNTEIFAFIAVLLFKLLTRKVLFINRKDNRNC